MLEKIKNIEGKVLNSQASEDGASSSNNPDSLLWFRKFFSSRNDSEHSDSDALIRSNNSPSGSGVFTSRSNVAVASSTNNIIESDMVVSSNNGRGG